MRPFELRAQGRDALALRHELALRHLPRVEDRLGEVVADLRGELGQQSARHRRLLVDRQAVAEAEFGIVLEQRVVPRRSAPVGADLPGMRRQVAAIDRRAAGGVGDLQPVAEKLADQLDVGRLAAAGAGAGELEQRLEELHAAHIGEIDPRAVRQRQRLEEGEVALLRLDQRLLVGHVDGLVAGLGRADRRAVLDADAAAGAILDMDLQREAAAGEAARIDLGRGKPSGAPSSASSG